jgi:hypothetical protein
VKKCPRCLQEIQDLEIVCPLCGREFFPTRDAFAQGAPAASVSSKQKFRAAGVVSVVAFIFLVWFLSPTNVPESTEPTRSSEAALRNSTDYTLPDSDVRDVQKSQDEMRREEEHRTFIDEVRTRDSFRRSGRWRASLCVMSSESGWLGSRAGTASISVFQKVKGDWNEVASAATPGTTISGDKMRCADVHIDRAGTFDIDVSSPGGSNFIVDISGGGRSMRAKGSK